MEAYQRAVSDGSDFLGIDVVSTADGVLVCRPDITLDDNTNVASLPQFAGRKSLQASRCAAGSLPPAQHPAPGPAVRQSLLTCRSLLA